MLISPCLVVFAKQEGSGEDILGAPYEFVADASGRLPLYGLFLGAIRRPNRPRIALASVYRLDCSRGVDYGRDLLRFAILVLVDYSAAL